MTESSPDFIIKPADYKEAIKNNEDFYIQFNTLTPSVEALIIRIIHRYLEEYDILYIKDTVISVAKELINNAIKANLKRLYFKLKGLDISKTEDYRNGMEHFKQEAYHDDEQNFLEKLKNSNFVVRVAFKTFGEQIHLSVINNIEILEAELKKIQSRISKAYKYKDISDAFEDVLDESEGAGLGLIMAMMLCKNTGLGPDSFKIFRKDDRTIATLSIPQNLVKKEKNVEITEKLVKEIDEIPAFPENIAAIQKLCTSPDVTIKEISEHISRDPALTTSILKLANSAGYLTIRKVDTIEEAVMKIGIKGINTLLVASGAFNIMDSRYKRYEAIRKTSYKRAFYAQKLSLHSHQSKNSEFAYLGALLADIGKIVLLSIDEKLQEKLKQIAGYKGLEDTNLLEEISLGLSHSTLGSLIVKKWRFNDALITAIELNRRPHLAPDNLKQLIYTIYIADCLVEIESRRFRFEFIDEDVLDYLNLNSKTQFEKLHSTLKESYESQS